LEGPIAAAWFWYITERDIASDVLTNLLVRKHLTGTQNEQNVGPFTSIEGGGVGQVQCFDPTIRHGGLA